MILSKYVLNDSEGSFENPIHDEITNKKIHQHLSNQHDIISEEDIKQVRTDFDKVTGPERAGVQTIRVLESEPVSNSLWDVIKK